jgi:thiol:disulfide interchange protein DsbA
MKTLVAALVLCLYLIPGVGHAQFQLGKQYVELPAGASTASGDKIIVREFFWYGCPHCYRLEPYIESWLKHIPSDVRFVRTPGVASRWLADARAFYTFQALGVTEQVHKDYFDAIHKKGQRFDNEASLVQFLAAHGVDPQKARNAYNSFGVRTQVENAKQLNYRYAVASVPTITVDGRYKTDVVMAGGPNKLLALIDYLVEQSRQQRKRAAKS